MTVTGRDRFNSGTGKDVCLDSLTYILNTLSGKERKRNEMTSEVSRQKMFPFKSEMNKIKQRCNNAIAV